jgi:predicted TPR repeat methyltransferase
MTEIITPTAPEEPEGVNVMVAMRAALEAAIEAVSDAMGFDPEDIGDGIATMPKTVLAAQNIPPQWTRAIVPAVFDNFAEALKLDPEKERVDEFPYWQFDENIAAMINAAAEFQMQQMQTEHAKRQDMINRLKAGNAGQL